MTASHENRAIEFADHLHEHFVNPVVMRNGKYIPPTAPGYSVEMLRASLDKFEFPNGSEWRGR